jgi:hypothetical protein
MRVPGHVTQIEVFATEVDRLWPLVTAGQTVALNKLEAVQASPPTKKRTGPAPQERNRIKRAMQSDLDAGQLTQELLRSEKGEALAARYHARRTTCNAARREILSELQLRQIPNTDK